MVLFGIRISYIVRCGLIAFLSNLRKRCIHNQAAPPDIVLSKMRSSRPGDDRQGVCCRWL